MKWFVLVTILGVAAAQTLFFRPHHTRTEKVKDESFGAKKPRFFYTSRKTALELASQVEGEIVVCPGNRSACATGSTCCLISGTATYGCCPMQFAVCCPDHKHCCPHNTKCDPAKGQCVYEQGRIAISWVEKTKSIPLHREDNLESKEDNLKKTNSLGVVVCPDGLHMCQNGQTCCKNDNGYACCPFNNAVCCPDEVHCCPENTKCDVSHSKCDGRNGISEMALKEKAIVRQTKISSGTELTRVVCPDHESYCQDGQTCCVLASGQYGCCPLPQAVCCNDHVHCCPHGYTCDVSKGSCNKGSLQVEWSVKTSAEQLKRVVCPDQTESCAEGQTCCELASGKYGCCPLPKAVCCSDHVHCCPEGTTCLVSKGQCQRGEIYMDWFEKSPAISAKNVPCPDGKTACPDGNTCCKLASGEYGCCPLPMAVCCNDHVHCCPNGYTCDVSKGSCNKGSLQVEWSVKTSAAQLKRVVCPDQTEFCAEGQTCCELASGKYGCCPLPKAVCCSDHVHCCPEGTTCLVSKSQCQRGEIYMDWFEKSPAISAKNVPCPDGKTACPDGNTCCKLASGEYGCCPLPKAVCCNDHVHCCPNGYTCDVSKGSCNKGSLQVEWSVKTSAVQLKRVVCPDQTEFCAEGQTCCELASGKYGCCPLPKAVCCSDHVHCCPEGTTCLVSKGQCQRGEIFMDWFEKSPAISAKNVPCPDGKQACPDGNTCCKLASGEYGCCPLPKAVCCNDHVHCCPNGYTCDVSKGSCNKGSLQVEWSVKTSAVQLKRVVCPDQTEFCAEGQTCCELASGKYGCCPLPKAVCCSDHVHCCPEGTTCLVSKGQCQRGEIYMDWFEKSPAISANNVPCPDGKTACPDGNTCCKLASGEYGCCPLPKAVCCNDHVHCCPNGYTCDVSKGSCNKGSLQVEWSVKTSAVQLKRVVCPDQTEFCAEGQTCCELASGKYGCCPLPKAVCCSDHVHCCPEGTTCLVSKGQCQRGEIYMDWFEKSPAISAKNVPCPDGKTACPDGNTCCKLASGEYGCCPLPKAVCCNDHVHCCPNGYTCDVSKGSCNKGSLQVEWSVKTSAVQLKRVVCPDQTEFCAEGQTCCELASGKYGCCPLPKAVCCSDHIHCCPEGTTCDVSQGKCNRGDIQVDWFLKTPAIDMIPDHSTQSVIPNPVKCDDTHECPTGNTCCKLSGDKWGCCPLPNAVCCSDHRHCCPNGEKCDVSQGKCIKGDTVSDWLVKTPAISTDNVICPGGQFECQSGETCCTTVKGVWACCPIPNAVCCEDKTHCCPSGMTCDKSGHCHKQGVVTGGLMKLPAKPRALSQLVSVVYCPDGSECADGETCCLMNNIKGEDKQKTYGCCPLPNAVCCDDHIHCCPQGFTCNIEHQDCEKGLEQLSLFPIAEKQGKLDTAALVKKKVGVVCPGGQVKCGEKQICCDNGKSGYYCCIFDNGVCCKDKQHCCPHGYVCDEEPGICRIPDYSAIKSTFLQKISSRQTYP